MKFKSYPPTPELDKMSAVKDKSQIIGAFLDQLSEQGLCLAKWVEGERNEDDVLAPVNQTIEETLSIYFDIDLKKVEKERQAILAHIRS